MKPSILDPRWTYHDASSHSNPEHFRARMEDRLRQMQTTTRLEAYREQAAKEREQASPNPPVHLVASGGRGYGF